MTSHLSELIDALGGIARVRWAIGVLVSYLLFCGAVYVRRRARTVSRHASGRDATDWMVVYASQTGFAEELATLTTGQLRTGGMTAAALSIEHLDASRLQSTPRILFVVSTTGQGDAPDAAARFQGTVMPNVRPLDSLRYGILALGDRTYEQYCAFGFSLDGWLRARSAVPLFDMVDVDDGDRTALDAWQRQIGMLCGSRGTNWEPAANFHPWTLVERTHLNPGSPGAPAFHVVLTPSAPEIADWHPGDVAEIIPATVDDDAATITRDYSIGSVPSDGRIELLVRQVRKADRALGVGSGWLTQHMPLGTSVRVKIRRNRAFHPPESDCPLVLIGNGTGLAGLRAHLKIRARQGRGRNWLLFGERTRAHDFFYRDEITEWVTGGSLERCDLAFSRDQSEPRYVQHLVHQHASTLRQWVDAGAAIYVCGSRVGMASGVSEALTNVLGDETLARLSNDGRYRRDVY